MHAPSTAPKPRTAREPRNTRTRRTLLAAAALALSATLLAPVATAGAAQAAPGAPGGITGSWGTGANDTTVTATWTSPGGTYLEYDVTYRIDDGTVWNPTPSYPSTGWTTGPTGVRTASASITGLDKTKTYVVAVRARDRETGLHGRWGFSSLVEPAGTPGRTDKVREQSRTATELTLTWGKVADAAGGYEVRVSEYRGTWSWAPAKTVAQSNRSTVTATLQAANLPSGYSNSTTYIAQVRAKSSTGVCEPGVGTVPCSRWVQSDVLAQLDIIGLDLQHVTPANLPNYVEEIGYDMRATWHALPSELTNVSYRAQFYYRLGNPADQYDATDDNSVLHAIPDSWHQDWEWYSLCNDGDATNDPARGCAKPCADSWKIHCERTTPYPKPQWYFEGGPGWGTWVTVPSTACSTATNICSHTFPIAASGGIVTLRVKVYAVHGSRTGDVALWQTNGPRPPTAVNKVYVCAASGASVRVEWIKGFHNGADITSYNLHLNKKAAGANPGGTTHVLNAVGTVVTADDPRRCDKTSARYTGRHPNDPVRYHMFHGVDTNRSYDVNIHANNSQGTGPAKVSATVSLTPTAPPAPAPPTATMSATSAALSWAAPADDGGSAVTGYKVRYRSQNADDTWGSWTDHTRTGTGTTTTETVGSLTASTTYQFQVRATNTHGDGPWSAAKEAATPASG